MKKKICIITSIHPDFDQRIMKQAKSLADNGYNVDLICPWETYGNTFENLKFISFPRVKKRSMRYKNYCFIWKIIKKKNYDIYHFHDIDILPFFCFIKFNKKCEIIYDIHENYDEEMMSRYWIPPYLRKILYLIVKYGQMLCCLYIKNLVIVSEYQSKMLSSHRYNKVIIRNFATKSLLDFKIDNYLEREDTVLFLGKHYEDAGSMIFLESAKRVLSFRPNVKFICIDYFGEDFQLKKKFIDYINKNNLKKQIKLLPFIKSNDIMKYMNVATIAVLPYKKVKKNIIGLPTKIFEHMAAGLPIVASDLPLIKKIIEENNCGLIAKAENYIDFADKIIEIIDNRKKAKTLGDNGLRAYISKYSWEIEEKKLLEMYKMILNP